MDPGTRMFQGGPVRKTANPKYFLSFEGVDPFNLTGARIGHGVDRNSRENVVG
jgi:hypothetical protein